MKSTFFIGFFCGLLGVVLAIPITYIFLGLVPCVVGFTAGVIASIGIGAVFAGQPKEL